MTVAGRRVRATAPKSPLIRGYFFSERSSPFGHGLGIWWERLAVKYLELPREKWGDRRNQMEDRVEHCLPWAGVRGSASVCLALAWWSHGGRARCEQV